jgi:hypothetical protein
VETDLLGEYRGVAAVPRSVGSLAFCASVILTVAMQRVQLALRREEAALWWASNGRDLVNALSLLALVASLRLIGFPGASALLVGATALLGLNLSESIRADKPRALTREALCLAMVVGVTAPVLLFPAEVHSAMSAVVDFLAR